MSEATKESREVVWRPIRGYEAFYEISETGAVRALFAACKGQLKVGRILKPQLQSTGYLTVTLCPPGTKKPTPKPIHRLVLETFVGAPDGYPVCRHLDGNPRNNDISNLAWGTHKDNEDDKKRHGRKIEGTRQWKSRLDPETVKAMRRLDSDGVQCEAIAKMVGVSNSAAWAAIRGKTWKFVT